AGFSPAFAGDLYGTEPAPFYDSGPLQDQNVFEGWWLGGTLGGATVNYDFSPGRNVDTSGLLGGVIGGWSWQSGPFVIGAEADLLAADVSGSRRFNAGLNRISPSIDSMADLRLRAGYTITPELLLFGTFGGAWANAELPIAGPGGGIREADFFGWSIGGGAEVALTPNGMRASTTSSPISTPRR
ncbi:MAG: outer membrane beta-barrel protein, partial [Methyloceanibacter sp.]